MAFLVKDDLKQSIRLYRLDQILDADNTVFDQAALTAESEVKNALFQHYDIQTIFNATGSNRDSSVIRWVANICLYVLHDRIPDDAVPARIVKNYDDTMKLLVKIAEGDIGVNLPRKIIAETGKPKTKTRWGSIPKRSH